VRIDHDKCTACELCIDCCPAEAIKVHSVEGIYISEDRCFDCGLCRRLTVCPADAFVESERESAFPGNIRARFSNPGKTHPLTMIPGRGTEECKTNDVSGRVKRGETGILIEVGRPGIGCTFRDISLITSRLKGLDVKFEKNNPLSALMDEERGTFSDKLLSQRILSAIVEVKIQEKDLEKVLKEIIDVGREIDTVFSLSLISRFEGDGSLSMPEKLSALGISVSANAKINLGLGSPLVDM
jgi:ferredoxin